MLDGFFACYAQWLGLGIRLKFFAPAIDIIRRFIGHSPNSSSAIAPSLVGFRIRGF